MSEKKELKNEELEKVTGGKYQLVKDINWLFSKDETAYVILTDNTQVEGKVTKKGGIGSLTYAYELYYIESSINASVNGWYPGEKFNNKTVSIDYKYNGIYEPIVFAW